LVMVGRSDLPLDAVSLLNGLKSAGVRASERTYFDRKSLSESRRHYVDIALRYGALLDISEVIGKEAYTFNDTGLPDDDVRQTDTKGWTRVRRVGITDVPLPRRGGFIDPLSAFDDRSDETAARREAREQYEQAGPWHGRSL